VPALQGGAEAGASRHEADLVRVKIALVKTPQRAFDLQAGLAANRLYDKLGRAQRGSDRIRLLKRQLRDIDRACRPVPLRERAQRW